MAGYTKFTKLEAEEVRAGTLLGPGKAVTLTKAASYSLAESEKVQYIGLTLTAASKAVTLGLPDGTVCIVMNEGDTNAFTLKNVSGDSGTSLAAGKLAVVRASTTANGSKITVLN